MVRALFDGLSGIGDRLGLVKSPPVKPVPLIVFESDDWGSIRMPSKAVKNEIGIHYPSIYDNPYMCFDCLESDDDLIALFNVLQHHTDSFGRNAVITANCISQNPDFDEIRKNGFSTYTGQSFFQTFFEYNECSQSLHLEKQALERGLFFPQFHGREHLNVYRWMKGLQEGDKDLLQAFNRRMISFSRKEGKSPCISQYMDAMNVNNKSQMDDLIRYTCEGLRLFRETWGFSAETMIAPCYFWHPLLEDGVKEMGIKAFQGLRVQKIPGLNGDAFKYSKRNRRMGDRNVNGQYYLVRNAFFEPATNQNVNWVENCLAQISKAIKANGIAIISVHRLNFIGSINRENREKNLKLFNSLLEAIPLNFKQFSYGTSADVVKWLDESSNASLG
jgi:hypothetical protein